MSTLNIGGVILNQTAVSETFCVYLLDRQAKQSE